MNDHTNKTAKKMVVGLIGWYDAGNFGDDLMGVLLADRLSAMGHEVVIFRLCDTHTSATFRIETDPNQFSEDVDLLIWGGGGIYTNGNSFRLPDDCWSIIESIKQRKVPFIGISLGGDKTTSVHWKQFDSFARQFDVQTIRDVGTYELLREKGIENVVFGEDILWSISTCDHSEPSPLPCDFLMAIEQKGKERVLLGKFLRAMSMIAKGRSCFVVPWYKDERPSIVTDKDSYTFQDLWGDVAMIRDCKITLTTKLHMGLLSLAFGNGFVSVAGESKTRLMLQRLGLKNAIVTIRNPMSWIFMLRCLRTGRGPMLSQDALDDLKESAEIHFQVMEDAASSHAQVIVDSTAETAARCPTEAQDQVEVKLSQR